MSKARHISFAECDSTEEVCGLFNDVFQELHENRCAIEGSDTKRSKAKAKNERGRRKAVEIVSLVVCLVASLCPTTFAAYTVADIQYDTVSNPETLTQMLRDLFANYQGSSILLDPQTTAPTAAEGKVYYNDTANALYVCCDGSTWTLIDVGSGTSLDSAYDLGAAITVDGDAITLTTGAAVDNSVLTLVGGETTNNNDTLVITHAGTGDAISINGASTGNLIHDEDGNFTVSSAGVMTFAGGTVAAADFLFDDTYDVGWDTSEDTFYAADDAKIALGTNFDWVFSCDNTDGNLEAASANDMFRFGETTNFDFAIHGGTNTNVITFDTDDVALSCTFDGFDLVMNDDDIIEFGDSKEFSVYYDETTTDNLIVSALNGNDAVQIGDGTTVTDFILQSTGDAAAQVTFDGSGDTNNGQMLFGADDHGIDVKFFGAAASQLVEWDQSVDTWNFGADAEGVDVYVYGDTTLNYMLWDESDDRLEFVAADILMDDDSDLIIGSGSDFVIDSDTAATLDIIPLADDETAALNIGVDESGIDVSFFGATSGDKLWWDADQEELFAEDVDVVLNEGSTLIFEDTGGAADWTVKCATAERLEFLPTETTDDQTFNIGDATNTSDVRIFGATASTVVFDASGDEVIFDAYDLSMQDGDFIKFGDGDDFTLDSSTAKTLDVAPAGATDDYAVIFGVDESGVDIKAFAATTGDFLEFDASDEQLELTGVSLVGTGDETIGGFKKVVVIDIDDRSVAASESGSVFTNYADTDTSVFTLPTAVAGYTYTFIDTEATAAEDLCILAAAGDKIQGGTAAQYYNCYDDTAFSYVVLVAIDVENWIVISSSGTWTADSNTTDGD